MVCLSFCAFSCSGEGADAKASASNYRLVEGETMGTYYRVTYNDPAMLDHQASFDSLLLALNLQVSTYIDSSTISRFNHAGKEFLLSAEDDHFIANFKEAKQIFSRTNGCFDPTVMPLVNYWGFGYTEKKPVSSVDSSKISVLMNAVGMRKVDWKDAAEKVLLKSVPELQLDFSAIAKGYGVDLLGKWLEQRGIEDYLVDIGGELRARGHNASGKPWRIGINVPREHAGFDQIQTTLPLRDMSVATSGNYRNYYEVNGQKYSHTINPFTGFPERNPLLSASILTGDCTLADAYATACMVMGLRNAMRLVDSTSKMEAYFIYSDDNGEYQVAYSKGFLAQTAD